MINLRRVLPVVALGLALTGATAPAGAAGSSFQGGPLPPAPGLGMQHNDDMEPGMAVDGGGTFWIGSNIGFNQSSDTRNASALSGVDVWKSIDSGRSYSWVADPLDLSGASLPSLGGEDSDIAAAPVANPTGKYNVYVTSLWLGSSSLAWSSDGGATWTVNPLGGVPAEDRPWLAAGGACDVYLAYHQLPTFAPWVNHYNVCDLTQSGAGVTLDPVSSTQIFLANSAPGLTNSFGKIWADTTSSSPHHGDVYVPMEGCDLVQPLDFVNNVVTTAEQLPICPGNTQLVVAISHDQGATWEDHQVTLGTNNKIGIWPATIASDAGGRLYFAWSDMQNVLLNTSDDGGITWSQSRRLNGVPSLSAVEATVGATGAKVTVAWYGTDRAGDSNDAKLMGKPGADGATQWHLYAATSRDRGATFAQSEASPVIHTGVLCTQGASCSGKGTRNLYDDFGVAVDPRTGTTSIAYTSDNYPGDVGMSFTAFATDAAVRSAEPHCQSQTSGRAVTPGNATGTLCAMAISTAPTPGGGQVKAAERLPNTSSAAGTPGQIAGGLLVALFIPGVAGWLNRRRRQPAWRRFPSR